MSCCLSEVVSRSVECSVRAEGAPLFSSRLAAIVQKRIADEAGNIDKATLSTRGVFSGGQAPRLSGQAGAPVLHTKTIPPIFGEVKDEWDANINDLALFEAVRFMDGTHTNAEIAELLSIELGENYDAAWVDRVGAFLKSQHLAE